MKIIKQAILLTFSNIFANLIGFLRGLLTAKLLSPENFGIWNMLSIVMSYSNYLDFGLNTGMLIETPSLIKSNDKIKEGLIKSQTFSAILYSNFILIFMLVIAYLFLSEHSWNTYLIIIAFSIITNSLLNYFNVAVRVKNLYNSISLSNLLISLVGLSIFIGGYKVYNRLTVEIVAFSVISGNLAGFFVLFMKDKSFPFSKINFNTVIYLIKIGFPVAILPILITLLYSIDRWIVAYIFNIKLLGLYSLGAVLGLSILIIPNSISYIMFTKQLEYKKEELVPHSQNYNNFVIVPILITSLIMAFVFGTSLIILPYFIKIFLPNFYNIIFTVNVLILSKCFLFALPVANNFLVSRGKKILIYKILILIIFLKIVLSFSFVAIFHNINTIAFVTLLTDFLYNTIILYYIFKTLPHNIKSIIKNLIPFIFVIPLALLLNYFISDDGIIKNVFYSLSVRTIVFWIISLFSFYKIYDKEIKLLKILNLTHTK